jgi:ATP-binding cassette subfamily C (CFTR/MRP) protein 1
VLVKSLKWPLLVPVIPRIFLSAFTFAQPFLITKIIQYLGEPIDSGNKPIGYGLVGAYGIVYIGIAVRILPTFTLDSTSYII